MPEAQLTDPRKRRHPEDLSPHQNKTSQHVSKKQKRSHPSKSPFPSAFWENLSKIDLTKRALGELDRRNIQAAFKSHPPGHPRPRRPITRRALAKLKKGFQPAQSAADYLCHCGTKALKNVKQIARHGGPDLTDLRDFPEPFRPLHHTMSSSQSRSRGRKRGSTSTSNTKPSTNTTTTTQSTGPYNRNFQQNLIDGGVYPHAYRYPDGRVPAKPNNWEEINRRLSQPRLSFSPSKFSEEAYEEFVQADADASKEKQVSTSVIPIIEGGVRDAKCVSGGIPFTNLDHLTDGTLVPGNPDIYYGARPEQLDRRVRDKLSGSIIPSTQDDLPVAPNFFLAAKGPDGSLAVAGRQACYDGALGARGMHSLQSCGQEDPVFDNNAFTISSIYHGGQLKMFTSHPKQPTNPGNRPEYYTNQVNTWGMTGNIETFRQGATYFRNGRDWTKEQRDEAIRLANERAGESQAAVLPVDASFGQTFSVASETTAEEDYTLSQESGNLLDEGSNTTINLQESDTSSGELALERGPPAKRSSRHSKRSRQSQRRRRNTGGSDDGCSR